MIKLCYLDLETTGVDERRHGVHQISGIIEIDGRVQQEFDYKVRPNPKAIIDAAALRVTQKSELDLLGYPPMKQVHTEFTRMLGGYVDKFDKKDKFHLVGYNIQGFDSRFLRAWFTQNGDQWGSLNWFYIDSLDVMILASQYLLYRRGEMPSFKLQRVARELGIEVDKERLHDAGYDVHLTRRIYRIVTGIDVEFG